MTPGPTGTPLPPAIVSLPTAGFETGGPISITGTAFVNGATVYVNGVAQPTTFISAGLVTVTLPAHAPGSVLILVQNPDLQSSIDYPYLYKPLPTATPPPVPSGDGVVKEAVPVPQPQSGPQYRFAVFIEGGSVSSLELKLYSRAYVRVATVTVTGSFGPGWAYPVVFEIPGLGNGTYFTRMQAGAGGKPGKAGRLVVTR